MGLKCAPLSPISQIVERGSRFARSNLYALGPNSGSLFELFDVGDDDGVLAAARDLRDGDAALLLVLRVRVVVGVVAEDLGEGDLLRLVLVVGRPEAERVHVSVAPGEDLAETREGQVVVRAAGDGAELVLLRTVGAGVERDADAARYVPEVARLRPNASICVSFSTP